MTEINFTHYKEIKFTRDTKVNYKAGNVVINTIFKQYDKDLSGDFSNEEWTMYENALKKAEVRSEEIKNINNDNVVGHYTKKLEKIAKESEKLYNDFKDHNFNTLMSAWDDLLQFEEAHPAVSRNGYIKKSEIPANAVKYDISEFGMGIFDKEKMSFTGKCYEKGYLLGLETLTKEERKQYLSLLDNAREVSKKGRKYEKKHQALITEFDKYKALEDMAKTGMISKVGSKDFEDQAYQQYVQIRNEANPFYREIRELEQKVRVLCSKQGEFTEEESSQIKHLEIQIQQLYNASAQWTVADANNCQKINGGQGFMLTDLSEQINYSNSNSKENVLTNTHSVGAMYSNENFNIMASFSNSQKYTITPESDFDNSFQVMLMGDYKREDFNISSTSFLNADKRMLNYNQSLGFGYKNLKINLNENISSMKIEMFNQNGEMVEQKNTNYTTTASLSYNVENVTSSVSASFSEHGNTYTLSSNANFMPRIDEKSSLNISPSLSTSYNDGANSYTVNPNLNLRYNYNNKDFRVGIMASENFNATMASNKEVEINHNLTTTGNISYKGFSTTLKYNNSDSQYNNSNTFGIETSYSTEKAGTFGLEYSYQNMKNKFNKTTTDTNSISFKYSAPLDWSRSKKNK